MTQGQRFRRRALRRGYKVDEVDAFLDRVEATLQGLPVDTPVTAQEVHDVVFRVRFGGYDEWQVDLHLDRVERQLAELEERMGYGGRPDPRMAPPGHDERVGGRMGAPAGPIPMMREERMAAPMPPAPPMREERTPPPMPARPVSPMGPAPGMPPAYTRYDEPTNARGAFDSFEAIRHKPDMTAEIRMGEPGGGMPPVPGPGPASDLHRIDQLRRTFQPRRFGSGYDQGQVDRLFDRIMAAMANRGVPVSEAELDPSQFNLVPGGYFEADVDHALREVREILRRR